MWILYLKFCSSGPSLKLVLRLVGPLSMSKYIIVCCNTDFAVALCRQYILFLNHKTFCFCSLFNFYKSLEINRQTSFLLNIHLIFFLIKYLDKREIDSNLKFSISKCPQVILSCYPEQFWCAYWRLHNIMPVLCSTMHWRTSQLHRIIIALSRCTHGTYQ